MNGQHTIYARGPTPEHLPAENGVHVWRTAIVMPIISALFVSARFYSRCYMLRRRLTIDDYIVGMTMVTVIIHAVLMANATYHGMGLHIWQFTPELNSEYYLWIGISSEFYVLSLAGFKSALLLLYLEIFGINRKFRLACYITLFYTLGYLTCNALTEFLGCHPIAKKWHSDLPGHCIDTVAANIAYGAGHMTSDLIIGILPIVMVWRLEFPTPKQKVGLSLALGSGLVAWAVACVRWAISTYNMLSYDRPWWAGISFTFSILEVNTGLICACVATFSPLLNVFTTRVRDWTNRASTSFRRSIQTSPSEKSQRHQQHFPQNFELQSNDSLEGDYIQEQQYGDKVAHPVHIPPTTITATYSPVSPGDELPPCDLDGLQALAHDNRV
ncbi:hypothetical protein F5Y15DRAFT_356208 [Xylariaceae sp. FL0016]|nr:hypothetical protein F5Y15DRAFT_356208 [Xylariaceae sp. FL0016]